MSESRRPSGDLSFDDDFDKELIQMWQENAYPRPGDAAEVRGQLSLALKKSKGRARLELASELALIAPERAVVELLAGLEERDVEGRRGIRKALARAVASQAATEATRNALRDPNLPPVATLDLLRALGTRASEFEPEAGACDQVADRTVEVAAAADPPPHRREAVLPPVDARVRRAPVLDEEQSARRAQHATHLSKGTRRVWDAAQRPCRYDRIDARGIERDRLGTALNKIDGNRGLLLRLARLSQEPR